MKPRSPIPAVAVSFAVFTLVCSLHAQPLVNIETVTVGDAGNAADATGFGAVGYEYRMGKYEVTSSQYAAFLNSVARTNTNSYIINLWIQGMHYKAEIAGISRSGSGTQANPYVYNAVPAFGNIRPEGASSRGGRPISYVNWFDAARFANWMHNGATNGASTETGAYTLNGATNGIFTKNDGATWWIPSEDEWYKAAYYKGGGTNAGYWLYPAQSDSVPGNSIYSPGNTNQANYYTGVYAVTQLDNNDEEQNYLTDRGVFSNSPSVVSHK
jgi:formylglycine-generating enzyme